MCRAVGQDIKQIGPDWTWPLGILRDTTARYSSKSSGWANQFNEAQGRRENTTSRGVRARPGAESWHAAKWISSGVSRCVCIKIYGMPYLGTEFLAFSGPWAALEAASHPAIPRRRSKSLSYF